MRLDQHAITEILASGDFARLSGVTEGKHLECKGQPYDLSQDGNKRELAKDVSSFANTDGGIIIIGARTKKSSTHFGDEIDEVRPFEQSLLNPNQYQKILNEWLFPLPLDVIISFHKAAFSPKGIFAINIPKQPDNLRPFLIKKTVEHQKIAEVLFGYAERTDDNSKPWSVVDLQNMLRKGLNYEKHLEQQFKLESLPAYRNESWQIKQMVLEKPDYWHFLLTEELLRNRIRRLRSTISDLENGALIRKHQNLSGREFRVWVRSKFQELEAAINLISRCINHELPDAWQVASVEPCDPMPILQAVDRLNAACNALTEWEADIFAVHPPDDLEPLRVALLGSTKETLDEIEKLPDHLAAAVRKGREHTGSEPIVYQAHLELRFTRSQLISETIKRLKESSAWGE